MITLKNGPITIEVDESNEIYGALSKFVGESFDVVGNKIHKVESNKEDDFMAMLASRKQDGQEINITEKDEDVERGTYNARAYHERFINIFGDHEEDDATVAYKILASHMDYYTPKHLEKAYDDISLDKSTDDLAVFRVTSNGKQSYLSVPRELLLNDEGS